MLRLVLKDCVLLTVLLSDNNYKLTFATKNLLLLIDVIFGSIKRYTGAYL